MYSFSFFIFINFLRDLAQIGLKISGDSDSENFELCMYLAQEFPARLQRILKEEIRLVQGGLIKHSLEFFWHVMVTVLKLWKLVQAHHLLRSKLCQLLKFKIRYICIFLLLNISSMAMQQLGINIFFQPLEMNCHLLLFNFANFILEPDIFTFSLLNGLARHRFEIVTAPQMCFYLVLKLLEPI